MILEIIILAAGQGTRMRSAKPKVLHEIGGKAMLGHVIATAQSLQPEHIHVVYGTGGDTVKEHFQGTDVNWVQQAEQLGTGHAVQQVMPHVANDAKLLILYGDVPLLRSQTLEKIVDAQTGSDFVVLTANMSDPFGLGRIIRDSSDNIERIVEHKDANDDELAVTEINTGVICASVSRLKDWLSHLNNDNAQGEYYLTDCVELATGDGVKVKPMMIGDTEQVLGINSKSELATAERVYQRRQAENLMQNGVTLHDPARLDMRGECQAGQDCEIDINVVLQGIVKLGDRVSIGPNCFIKDSVIENDVVIQANSYLENAHVSNGCVIGPYGRLRPGTELGENVRIGNFVEVKNSILGEGSKANHLAYVGDSTVGKGVNIGAGVITCNYDGVNKHKTNIGDGAFIGTNSALVAPVTVGKEAYIAAGSTINRNAPEGEMSIARARQTTVKGWQRAKKSEK